MNNQYSNPNEYTPPEANFFNLESNPDYDNLTGDLDTALESKQRLITNLTSIQSKLLDSLESLDSVVSKASGESLGKDLLTNLKKTSKNLLEFSTLIEAADDGCEKLVDDFLGLKPDVDLTPENEYMKVTLLSLIHASPPILNDISEILSSMSLSESTEICETGLSLSCVGILIAQFALEKIEVERVLEGFYSLEGRVEGFEEGGSFDVEYLNDSGEYERPKSFSSTRPLKRQALIFWPKIFKALLAPLREEEHPLRGYVNDNPKMSLLISLLLLSPPSVILSIIFLPPILITDAVVHKIYSSLLNTFPEIFEGLEVTTAQILEVIKLYYLIIKLFLKSSYRITTRQVKRRGGVTGVVKILGGKVWKSVKEPIVTSKWIWGGVKEGWRFGGEVVGVVRGGFKGGGGI